MKDNHQTNSEKTVAAVCGLYCEACTLFIATKEDPARLKQLAKRFGLPEEEMKCYGCRSEKRGPYCHTLCKMYDCAMERGIDFCSECTDYPCDNLKQFQSEAPHRIELWDDLTYIKEKGWEVWMKEARAKYSCPKCAAINSAYDLNCRKCGSDPSCGYVAKHRLAIETALKNW